MKLFKIILPLIAFLAIASSLKAQKNKQVVTDTLIVSGICGMCEERIENAALIKGVKKVDWEVDTQELIVIYREDKVTIDQIAMALADAGHDSELITCTDEQYDEVHNCCKYRDQNAH